jgi:hypothetical protein
MPVLESVRLKSHKKNNSRASGVNGSVGFIPGNKLNASFFRFANVPDLHGEVFAYLKRMPMDLRRRTVFQLQRVQGNTYVQRGLAQYQGEGVQQKGSSERPKGIQRVVAIGGVDLDSASLRNTQNEIVTTHLADVVENSSGDLLFTRSYRENLIRDTIRDMHQASDRFNYASVAELARDIKQRVLVSLYMRGSQGSTRRRMGFSYPDRASDGTAGVEAKVNDDAALYWGARESDAGGSYQFRLSPTGEADPYQAIVKLFTEQTNPHRRTLIHCDYLLSVLQYRAWAETIGVANYNSGIRHGLIQQPVLKWNGFVDMERPAVVPDAAPPYLRVESPLQSVSVSSEDDLIIGDHVTFYNHESYDALIEGTGGIWRLENAIVVDRQGGQNRYQGHGYFSPVPKRRLLAGMIRQYNRHVSAARRLTRAVDRARTPAQRTAALSTLHADYPNVQEKVGGGWEISGTGLCGNTVTRDLRPLTMAEAPGLVDPCTGRIEANRPVHTSTAGPAGP